MKMLFFHPYALSRVEGGVMYLLARYLGEHGVELSQLRCNGTFSLCERDGNTSWRRSATQCFQCMAEQSRQAEWAGLEQIELSSFLHPDDIQETKRWTQPLTGEQVWTAVWKGVPLRTLLQGSFSKRFGTLEPDFRNKQHDYLVRKLALAALRMLLASKICNKEYKPKLSFVSGGDEFLSASYHAATKREGIPLVRIQATGDKSAILIHHSDMDEPFRTDIVVENLLRIRQDMNTWPDEVMQTLDDIVSYLGLSQLQLALPLAQ